MIKWIRQKFKGRLDKKHRKLLRQIRDIDKDVARLQRRRRRMSMQAFLMEKVFSLKQGDNT